MKLIDLIIIYKFVVGDNGIESLIAEVRWEKEKEIPNGNSYQRARQKYDA